MSVELRPEHAEGNNQAEEVDGVEPGESREPELAEAHFAARSAIGIVVGEDEAGEQKKEADRGVAVVDDGCQPAEGPGIGKVEEDQVEGREGAEAGQGGKAGFLACRARGFPGLLDSLDKNAGDGEFGDGSIEDGGRSFAHNADRA